LIGQAGGRTIIISGDRHFAEISRVPADAPHAAGVLDVTSSGINRGYPAEVPTANRHRVGGYFTEPNVGELEITFPGSGDAPGVDRGAPTVGVRIYDAAGRVRLTAEM
jgi:hypothetical protein